MFFLVHHTNLEMKFTALFFIFAIVSSVFALPAASPQGELVHHVPLSKRNINFPARADDVLAAKIMAQLKLNLDTLVFASISATVSHRFIYRVTHNFNLVFRKSCCLIKDPCIYSRWLNQSRTSPVETYRICCYQKPESFL